MYVSPFGWSYAVAPVTIGTFSNGSYESLYGYTSADRLVYDRGKKF